MIWDIHAEIALMDVVVDDPPPTTGACEEEILDYEAGLIQRWTKVCLDEHTACGGVQRYMPTRVIDVCDLSAASLRLLHSAQETIADRRYLALSHCWGLTMPECGKTKTTNLDTHLECISYESLPRTFQDFIDIARRVKVRYVWIDSLCIIQDSREDWEKEAAQMADVYSKSYLTVAASGSANGTEGCRIDHETRSYGPVDVVCLGPPIDSTPPTPVTYRIWAASPNPSASTLLLDPLSKRGWTLQERELSPRVVHYSKDTIRWECRELAATLEFPCGDRLPFDAGRLFDGGSDARPAQIGNPSNDSKPLDHASKQIIAWFELVQKYTARKLTKQTDRLPALSGLARMIASQSPDQYLAGLWKSHFCHCLLWASAVRSDKGFQHSRSSLYMAPSWSWASISGPVEYLGWVNGYWYVFNASPDPAFLPEILNVTLCTSAGDPEGYNMLRAGSFLRVKGKVHIAYSLQSREPYGERLDLFSAQSSSSSDSNKIGEIRYDVPLCANCAPPARMEFVFLLCCTNGERSKDGTFRTFALALKPEDEEMVANADLLPFVRAAMTGGIDTFRRVGVAWGIDPSFWETAWNMTLKVV